ncbi:Cyclin-dependent kinase 2-interacting protein [Sciurus carolinensis]|uniref:Cyclin-dependent kinase 2-interacting protein n=1 Tax=Sciurus carolinensis TaxID=30640 RepID=A0AA41NCT7_SCICA|nr:Cyclin-dependent kinase 2-interacting protein [Sciurus carolinensis]
MEKLFSTTKGICELENYHYGEESERPPMFHMWSTTHLYEVSHQLSDTYRQEFLLKCTVGAELAHMAEHDLALSYLSVWLYQPYMESMLLETGHQVL